MAILQRRGKVYYARYREGKRQRMVCLRTTSRALAQEKLHEIEAKVRKGEDPLLPTKTPVSKLLADYLTYIRAAKTRNTVKSEHFYLRDLFGPRCPELPEPGGSENSKRHNLRRPASGYIDAEFIEEITTAQIVSFILGRKEARNLSPKTCNHYRGILSRVFSWATSQYGVRMRNEPNPAQKVERYREPARTIRFLSREQIKEQMRVLEAHPLLRTSVAIATLAGLRREEILWLTRQDIDLGAGKYGIIHVRAKTVEGEFWQPKTKTNRVVPISRQLRQYLDRYTVRLVPGGWYLPSPKGKRWNPDNFSQDLRAINEKAGLPWGCLDYRHTFGSHLAMKGESLYKISTLMGNSPEICRRHYAALLPESLIDTVEFMDIDDPCGPSAQARSNVYLFPKKIPSEN